MFVAVAEAELYLAASTSLKAKRKVIHSVRDRIHARHRVSIAEIDHHDLWQRATLGIASVHAGFRDAGRMNDRLRELLDDLPEAELVGWQADVWS